MVFACGMCMLDFLKVDARTYVTDRFGVTRRCAHVVFACGVCMLPAIIGFRAIMESEEMEEEARRCERTLDPRRVGVCVLKAATIGTASRKMSLTIFTIRRVLAICNQKYDCL